MNTPQVGSLWIDTEAKVPASLSGRIGTLRRVVKVLAVNGLFAHIVGRWQEQRPDGAWQTWTIRAASAGVASFGRKYQPLKEN